MALIHTLVLCFSFIGLALCGNVNIGFHPSSLRFGSGSAIKTSAFVADVIAASLGYTTPSLPWDGLTVPSPFKYPSAAIIFDIPNNGVEFPLGEISYELLEDSSTDSSFADLHQLLRDRAQRPLEIRTIQADELGVFSLSSLPTLQHLKITDAVDAPFLHQVSLLPSLKQKVENVSTLKDGGQDIFMVKFDSFAPLVKNYGKTSPQVREAVALLRSAISQAIDQLRKFYKEDVVVATLQTVKPDRPSRRTRSILQSPKVLTLPPDVRDYLEQCQEDEVLEECLASSVNVAAVYDEDYPVIFNMILILTIILTVAILAVSMSMALMDPGRDSIIYRMTNPRMKKD